MVAQLKRPVHDIITILSQSFVAWLARNIPIYMHGAMHDNHLPDHRILLGAERRLRRCAYPDTLRKSAHRGFPLEAAASRNVDLQEARMSAGRIILETSPFLTAFFTLVAAVILWNLNKWSRS